MLGQKSLPSPRVGDVRPASSRLSARNQEEADENGKLLRSYKKPKGEEEDIEKMKDDDELVPSSKLVVVQNDPIDNDDSQNALTRI
jgi:hypothetical protein